MKGGRGRLKAKGKNACKNEQRARWYGSEGLAELVIKDECGTVSPICQKKEECDQGF